MPRSTGKIPRVNANGFYSIKGSRVTSECSQQFNTCMCYFLIKKKNTWSFSVFCIAHFFEKIIGSLHEK